MNSTEPWLTPKEVAALFKKSDKLIYLAKKQGMPFIANRTKESWVARWFAKNPKPFSKKFRSLPLSS